jgi:hypothetical protein
MPWRAVVAAVRCAGIVIRFIDGAPAAAAIAWATIPYPCRRISCYRPAGLLCLANEERSLGNYPLTSRHYFAIVFCNSVYPCGGSRGCACRLRRMRRQRRACRCLHNTCTILTFATTFRVEAKFTPDRRACRVLWQDAQEFLMQPAEALYFVDVFVGSPDSSSLSPSNVNNARVATLSAR